MRCFYNVGLPHSERPACAPALVDTLPEADAALPAPDGVQVERPPHASLLRVIRTIVRADSDPARQTLFTHVKDSHLLVRLVFKLHEKLGATWASAALVSGYGLVAFFSVAPPAGRHARLLATAGHENAQRQVERVMEWIGRAECGWVRAARTRLFTFSALAGLATLLRHRPFRGLRVVRAIDRRHGFLVACRAAAGIAWYARTREILAAAPPGVVVVSSDSNPEEVGLVGAARAMGIPQVFVSHAYPTPFSPPLDFTLSILEGEAAVRVRRAKGPIAGAVLLAGIEGESAPIDVRRFERPQPSVGIFPPKVFAWETLARIVDECRAVCGARQIVIRWHPSTLEPPRLRHVLKDLDGVIESPRSASLEQVARQCDWVIAAENSNVHLPVLKLGIPTVVVKGLGLYPESRADLYGFVRSGIVFPPVASLRDITPGALAAFFSEQWQHRFAEYDASYLRPGAAVGHEVRRAIRALYDAPTTHAR
jgi:hypothetical protein